MYTFQVYSLHALSFANLPFNLCSRLSVAARGLTLGPPTCNANFSTIHIGIP